MQGWTTPEIKVIIKMYNDGLSFKNFSDIVNMRKEGKTLREIKQHFDKTRPRYTPKKRVSRYVTTMAKWGNETGTKRPSKRALDKLYGDKRYDGR